MMAMTTSSSMSVNALGDLRCISQSFQKNKQQKPLQDRCQFQGKARGRRQESKGLAKRGAEFTERYDVSMTRSRAMSARSSCSD